MAREYNEIIKGDIIAAKELGAVGGIKKLMSPDAGALKVCGLKHVYGSRIKGNYGIAARGHKNAVKIYCLQRARAEVSLLCCESVSR